ncbi:MAG: restriction endonuclease subunit S [Methylorubrum populi]
MTPSLRFPEFKDAWQPRHGDDAFRSRRQRAIEGLPLYSVTMDQGMVRRDSLEREFASNAPDEANLRVFKDDHVYNMMRMWQGAVGRAPEDCMVSPAYVVLQPKPDTVTAFFDHWFKRKRSVYLLWAYSYGLTSDRLRLYARDFARVPMVLPMAAEQRKIAHFLGLVDERIKLLHRQRVALARYKKGVMQRLFDRSLRFTRDDATAFPDWTACELGSVFDWVATNSLSREMLTYEKGEVQNIHYGDIHGKFSARFRQSAESVPFIKNDALPSNIRKDAFCKPGDVIIVDASEDYADIGKAVEVIEVAPMSLVAGLHTYIARPKAGVLALGFSAYLFQSQALREQIMRIAQGISVLGISRPNLSKLKICLPHLDEQRKVAAFLGAIDDKIAAASAKVAQMETFKKGLLQQMFV